MNKQKEKNQEVNLRKSYEELEADFMPLILSAVKHYQGLADWDDLYQEARLAFYQGVIEFDTEGPVYFAYYIKKQIYGHLRTYTRREGRRREQEIPLSGQASNLGDEGDYFEDPLDMLAQSTVHLSQNSLDDEVADKLDMRALLDSAGLSQLEREIIEIIYYQGYSQLEAGREIGMGPALVRYHLAKTLARLGRKISEEKQG